MNNLAINTLKEKHDTLTELFNNKKASLTALEIEIYIAAIKDLRKSINRLETDAISLHVLRRIVARSCDLDEKDLLSKSRAENIVIARVYYAYFAKLLTEYSLNEIGAPIKKDHSMVLYYLRQYNDRTVYDKKFIYYKKVVIDGLSVEYPGISEQLQEELV